MSIYVTSDAHGHLRALDRALELAAPSSEDTIYVLGDMIDRGPDPLGVIDLVRSLPNVHVLMGNHERLMLDALSAACTQEDIDTWDINGGWATLSELNALPVDTREEIIDWVEKLPLMDVVDAAARSFILVHAGIDSARAREFLLNSGIDVSHGAGAVAAGREMLLAMLADQNPDVLLWTRHDFWGQPTGLVGSDGSGPIVIAGHTPSLSLSNYADVMDCSGFDEDEQRGCIVRVGASEATGDIPDRIDIDCSAASGCDFGAVGVMRLDDGAHWYAPVLEGE